MPTRAVGTARAPPPPAGGGAGPGGGGGGASQQDTQAQVSTGYLRGTNAPPPSTGKESVSSILAEGIDQSKSGSRPF